MRIGPQTLDSRRLSADGPSIVESTPELTRNHTRSTRLNRPASSSMVDRPPELVEQPVSNTRRLGRGDRSLPLRRARLTARSAAPSSRRCGRIDRLELDRLAVHSLEESNAVAE